MSLGLGVFSGREFISSFAMDLESGPFGRLGGCLALIPRLGNSFTGTSIRRGHTTALFVYG